MNPAPIPNTPTASHPFLAAKTMRALREKRGLTQRDLAERLGVTSKAISRWETGRGLPDIMLIEPLARTLGVSVADLLAGDVHANANRTAHMVRSVFYVCPICGNVIIAAGEGSFSCCGSTLLPQEATTIMPDVERQGIAFDPLEKAADIARDHAFSTKRIEDDWFLSLDHPMTKSHYISFAAYVASDGVQLKKLYPEQPAEARFHISGSGWLYMYCNQHGLFRMKTAAMRPTCGTR